MFSIILILSIIIILYFCYSKYSNISNEEFTVSGTDDVYLEDSQDKQLIPNYEVDYTILPTKYINKCGNKKAYWNYTNYSLLPNSLESEKRKCSYNSNCDGFKGNPKCVGPKGFTIPYGSEACSYCPGLNKQCKVIGKKSSNNCEKECNESKECDSYLIDENKKCHFIKLNKNNVATYRCNRLFKSGTWYGDIKSSAKTDVKKFKGMTLNPGDIIALWNTEFSRFMRMDSNGYVYGTSEYYAESRVNDSFNPPKTTWMWMVIDLGNKEFALWNIGTKRFAMYDFDSRYIVGSEISEPSTFNEKMIGARIKVVPEEDNVVLMNPASNKYYYYGMENYIKGNSPAENSSAPYSRGHWKPIILINNSGCYKTPSSTQTPLGKTKDTFECARLAARSGNSRYAINGNQQCVSLTNGISKVDKSQCSNYIGNTETSHLHSIYNQSLYTYLHNSKGDVEYNIYYHLLENGYKGALGSCGNSGCGLGIGTYPQSTNYFKNNINACTWMFVPKGEDEDVKKKTKCPPKIPSKSKSLGIDNRTINYGDIFSIRSKKNGYWLVTCGLNYCGSPAYLSVSANEYRGPSNIFAGNAQYWKFESKEGKTGPVNLKDNFRLINLWGNKSSLNTCWHYNCGGVYYGGYGVNTAKINSSNYNGITSSWSIKKAAKDSTFVPYGNRYCKSYDSYQRHKTKSLEDCKNKCGENCNAIALGPDCVTYNNCKITDNNKKQSWGFDYYLKKK